MLRALALFSLVATTANAAPAVFTHQGRLLDSTGTPINGSHELAFNLYDAPSGGTNVWSEVQSTVDLSNGYYAVSLGEISALDPAAFADSSELWIALTLDGGVELARQPLASVPWALHAANAGGLSPGLDLDVASISINGTTVLDSAGLAAPVAWSDVTGIPDDLADGDADTLGALTCTDGQVAQSSGGQWSCATPYGDTDALAAVSAADTYLPRTEAYTNSDAVDAVAATDAYLPRTEAYADDDAVDAVAATDAYLPRTEAYVDDDAVDAVAATDAYVPRGEHGVMAGDLEVGGDAAFDGRATFDGGLYAADQYGPYNWVQFTTDMLRNNPTNQSASFKVATIRCSGHWGSYAADIELVNYYYRPGIRRFTYYCGNGNHTSGGVLQEHTSQASGFNSGGIATFRKVLVGNSGHSHSGIAMYDVELWIDHPAYVQTYMRVTTYSPWASKPAGTDLSTSTPYAVWHGWNQ